MINTQPQPRLHAATAPPQPKQSTTQTHYKITPNNHGPTPDPITNHPNNQRHQPRHDRYLGPIGPPNRVESEREEESERDEPGEEKSEHDVPWDRISEGGEHGGESQRLGEHRGTEVEQGDNAERNREWETERQSEV